MRPTITNHLSVLPARVSRLAQISFLLLLAWVPVMAWATGAGGSKIVSVQVLGIDGKPSSGTLVYLISGDKDKPVRPSQAEKMAHYHWRTDKNGRFQARFVNGETTGEPEDEDAACKPGWAFGAYHFVALPGPGHSGGVSPDITHPDPGFPDTPKLPSNVVVQLQKGFTLDGVVVDSNEKPIEGLEVSLWNDLHALTSSGHGNEIFDRSTKTDSRGRFVFERVNPSDFVIDLSEGSWCRTRFSADKPWQDDRIDHFEINKKSGPKHIEIMGAKGKIFRFYGAVVDEAGHPIPTARVAAWQSFHKIDVTYDDDHTFPETRTDAAGKYEILLSTPWIRAIEAETNDFAPQVLGEDNPNTSGPGRYDFKLTKAPPAK